MIRTARWTRVLPIVAAVAVAACDGTDSPTSIDSAPLFALGDRVGDVPTEYPGGIGLVCALYPDDGMLYGASSFEASATGGDVLSDFTISDSPLPMQHCIEVWNATDATAVDLTASLADGAPGLTLERIVVVPSGENLFGVTEATVAVSDLVGAGIWFKFVTGDEPGGGEGCTPGYWKQPHHFDSWVGYTPDQQFSSVFDDAFPGMTLHDVLRQGGGKIKALGRHAVAALLNASSTVDYDYTAAEVIDLFNAAAASGDKDTIEDQKNVFDMLNNQGCTLN